MDIDEIMKELDGNSHVHEEQEIHVDNIVEQQQNVTKSEINLLVNLILLSNKTSDSDGESWLKNSTMPWSTWQKSQLERVKDDESGIRCLLNSWLVTQKDLLEGKLILIISKPNIF